MRRLLNECLDRRLAKDIVGHEGKTIPQMGWATIKNGEWLTRAEDEFDVFLAVDRNRSFQQNLPRLNPAVMALGAQSIRLLDLRPLVPELLDWLPCAKPGEVLWINGSFKGPPDLMWANSSRNA